MKKAELIKYIDSIAPFKNCVAQDNVGELIKGKDEITRVMVCLDISKQAVDFAVASKVDMIITHHPVIYDPLYRILDDVLISVIQNKIGIISAHTNYDAARLNDVLAKYCGIADTAKIFYEDGIFLGRIGNVEETTFLEYMNYLKAKMNLEKVKITGIFPDKVRRVAVGTGSSNSFSSLIPSLDADVFVCGELKYDLVKSIAEKGPVIVELGHYESEECFIDDLSELLKKNLPQIEVLQYKKRISTYI